MDQIGKTRMIINAFILLAICISLFQQMLRVTTPTVPAGKSSSNSNMIDQANIPQGIELGTEQYMKYASENNITISQKIPNLIIKVTDKLDSEIKTILATQGYNVEVKPYEFQGNQWYLNIILNYGHMVVMWFMMTKYKSEQNQSNKKKIMIIGFILVFGWMMAGNILKPQKIVIEFENKQIYTSDTIVKAEVISKISQYQDFNDFNDFNEINNYQF